MRFNRLLITVFIVLTGISLFSDPAAAEEGETILLTLDRAQELALQRNPQIQSAEKDIQKAQTQITQARGGMLPNLSAYTNYTHNFELPVITIEFPNPQTGQTTRQEFAMGTTENIQSGLQLRQPLFMGGRIWSSYQISQTGAEVTENQARITKQNVLLQVRQAFYNALFTQEIIAVSEEALNNARRNLDLVRKQKEAGTASGFDLLRAEVQVSNTKPQVIAAKHRHQQALTGLRTAIGLKKGIPIKIQGQLSRESIPYLETELDSLQELALQQRLEMENIRFQREIQERNYAIARSQLLPSLSASSNLQYQLQQESLSGLEGDDFVRSISGGLTLSIPLFAGGTNYGGLQQAKVELRKVDDSEQQVRNMIAGEVESAYLSLIDAREKLNSQDKTIEQATESLRLAELRYREGSATQLDILNAQLALQQAQTNYSQYLLEFNVAQDNLRKSINEFNFEEIGE